ncbi:MAG: glycosyltransferase family 4 protein [Candidatus Promineifilaceae bacterium]|nr:glycosyltransferase family 4 protein [Candidatus Promineifilaceae bacterium]
MTKDLHIAFFTNTYRPTMSGVVRSIDTFRQAFTDMGHNVFIFAQKAHKYEDKEPFIFRYPAVEVPFVNDYAFPMPFSRTIDNVLPSLKLDVIHSHHPFLLGDVAADKAKSLDLPMVFTFHTRYDEYTHYVPISPDLTKVVIDLWMSHYLEKCNHIITPSESIKEILIEHGVRGDMTAIPTGIDITPFEEADGEAVRKKNGWGDDLVLISVGRLAKEKSFDTLLEAAAKVMRERSHVRLVIVGGGLEKKSLEKLAKELGIADRVQFTGSIPYEDVPSHLKGADIFCFASTSETQGLVTMEAMAAGLPIVAVDATGTSDAVDHGQDGLLTDNNAEALAGALEQVIDDAELRQRLIDGAAKKVQWFDIRRQAQRMLDVYAQAKEAKEAGRFIKTKQES